MKKLNIIYGLLLFVLLVSMCSCVSRKVSMSEIKEETQNTVTDNSEIENNSESNVKETTTVKVDDKNQTVTEETEYTPQDVSKESFVIEKDGTKVILNNVKKIVRKTTQNNNTQSESKTDIIETKKEAVKEQKAVTHKQVLKKKIKAKQVDKKQFNPFNLIWIGSLCLLVLYIIYRIYKKLPLVPKF